MEKEKLLQLHSLLYLIEEGKYNPDDYPQNIEIINSIPDSFTLSMEKDNLFLFSDNVVRYDLRKFQINALKGEILPNGKLSLITVPNQFRDELYDRKKLIEKFLKGYPDINKNASIIGYHNWTTSSYDQMMTIIKNRSQDYYLVFAIDKDDKLYNNKIYTVESFCKRIEEDNPNYQTTHDTLKHNDYYLLKKKVKVKKRTPYGFGGIRND